MSDPITICESCLRPEATDHDYRTYDEGEGDWLCWRVGANCGHDPSDALIARLVERTAERDALAARVEELEARIARALAELGGPTLIRSAVGEARRILRGEDDTP